MHFQYSYSSAFSEAISVKQIYTAFVQNINPHDYKDCTVVLRVLQLAPVTDLDATILAVIERKTSY
jgi:hypothetical protein